MYPRSMFRAKIRKKNVTFYHLKIQVFTSVKNCSVLHGRVIVMESAEVGRGPTTKQRQNNK